MFWIPDSMFVDSRVVSCFQNEQSLETDSVMRVLDCVFIH